MSKLSERVVKVVMGERRHFSRGRAMSTFCLSFSGCGHYNLNERSHKALLFLHHKENALWSTRSIHILFLWNLYVELCMSLPQRWTFCHPLQFSLNCRIKVIIIVNWVWN